MRNEKSINELIAEMNSTLDKMTNDRLSTKDITSLISISIFCFVTYFYLAIVFN